MKYTLLELTKAVLSSMDSDEISSITDTVESMQVVEVIKTVYDDIVSRTDLQVNKTLFNLTESVDALKPIVMTKPSTIDKVEWIKYDGRDADDTTAVWNYVDFIQPDKFIERMHQQGLDNTWIGNFTYTFPDGSSVIFYYRNDQAPNYFTTFDDETLFFDAYDSAVDSKLLTSKTICYGTKISDFQSTDGYIPNLQPQQFALLLNEAKSLAWAELKQVPHEKAELTARRNWRHIQKTRNELPTSDRFSGGTHNFDRLPNFSRSR